MLKNNQKGFTLIELLIVIVIIGILAGVLIAIINPAQQQNRARDAGVQATINKVALATEGFVSAYGRTPTDAEFVAALSNADDCFTLGTCGGAATCAAGDDECIFMVSGNPLPVDCTTDWSGGGGGNTCNYRYLGGLGANVPPTGFQIYAKSFGIVNTIFRYDNTVGEIEECDLTGANCV